ncbi:MAG: hypothetical protein IJA36_01380 [Lachnospiraceae bacterium]|nr:hypothetical protein [Lachnospiraceae bacterium]
MYGKKMIKEMLTSYFTLVTLIIIVMFVMGSCFEPETTFGYEVFAVPLIYGVCGVLPIAVMYSKREMTTKEFIIRKIIQFILIEVLILFVAFYNTELGEKQYRLMLIMGVSIFVVYVFAHVIDWIQNYLSAKQMTEQLMRLQGK